MGRLIKFMVWDKKDRRFLRGNHSNLWMGLSGQLFWQFGYDYPDIVDMKDYDLYQFTGLLDKDGKEIYEGSVVEWNNTKTEILWDEDCPGYIFGNDIPGQHGMECLDEETAKTMKSIGHIAEDKQ